MTYPLALLLARHGFRTINDTLDVVCDEHTEGHVEVPCLALRVQPRHDLVPCKQAQVRFEIVLQADNEHDTKGREYKKTDLRISETAGDSHDGRREHTLGEDRADKFLQVICVPEGYGVSRREYRCVL